MAIYETNKGFNRQALTYIDQMVVQGVLTNTAVANANTVAELRRVLTDTVPSTPFLETGGRRFYEQYQKHIDKAEAIGILSDSAISGLSTVAQLVALFTDQDAFLSQTGNKSLVV